jgi:hypothetical protein
MSLLTHYLCFVLGVIAATALFYHAIYNQPQQSRKGMNITI